PGGLLVAVIRDCDKKGVVKLAGEIAAISTRAREKGLPMADMVGGCMTVSSLGHIGGTAVSPIINAPEVAILGVTKAQAKHARAGACGRRARRRGGPASPHAQGWSAAHYADRGPG